MHLRLLKKGRWEWKGFVVCAFHSAADVFVVGGVDVVVVGGVDVVVVGGVDVVVVGGVDVVVVGGGFDVVVVVLMMLLWC